MRRWHGAAGCLAMLGRELRWRHPPAAAVRPHLVVVGPPACDLVARLFQALEPVLVQALVAELAVEALDIGVLRGLAGLVEDVAHSLGLRPSHEGPAGELRALVGSDGLRIAPEPGDLVQHAHDVLATNAVIDGDVHALVAEVVGHGQALDAPPAGQAVADEVHAPHLVDGPALVQRHPFELQALLAAALAHRQVRQLVEPVHALVVDLRACGPQQIADAPVAEAPPFVRQLDDALARRLVVLGTLGWMPPAVARQTHQGAGAPFTDRGWFKHLAHRASLRRWAQRFTPKATFSASLSSTASASSFLSRLVSASRSRSRLA